MTPTKATDAAPNPLRRTTYLLTAAAAVALAIMMFTPQAQSAQMDTAEGLKLAQAWCSQGHVIAPTNRVQSLAPGAPPDFAAIARAPTTTEQALTVYLQVTHPRMPDFQMSRDQIASLVNYILSLWNK